MNEKLLHFLRRIDSLTPNHKAKYGKMNVHQMVCHCTDFYRIALEELTLIETPKLSKEEVQILAKERKTVPAPKDINQVAGKGAKPTNFQNDIRLLKEKMTLFFNSPKKVEFPPHFYFGFLTRVQWNETSNYHLHHHLRQFNA
jgi:hypothetical protein